jgi:hypothetical protein
MGYKWLLSLAERIKLGKNIISPKKQGKKILTVDA